MVILIGLYLCVSVANPPSSTPPSFLSLSHNMKRFDFLPLLPPLQTPSLPPKIKTMECLRRWKEGVVTQDGSIGGKDKAKRSIMLNVSMCTSVAACVVLVSTYFMSRPTTLLFASLSMGCLASVFIFIVLALKRDLTNGCFVVYFFLTAAAIGLADLHQETLKGLAVWPINVVLLDLMLVVRLSSTFTTALVSSVLMWVGVLSLEKLLRVGLFDMPGMTPMQYRVDTLTSYHDCEAPPCPDSVNHVFVRLLLNLFVFFLDYQATRRFAEAVYTEQDKMQRTVDTVAHIAHLLAGYDVDTVAEVLDMRRAELSEEMHTTLKTLEQNLRAYRPYLPASCLPFAGSDATDKESSSGKGSSSTDSSSLSRSVSAPLALGALANPVDVLSGKRATALVVNSKGTLEDMAAFPAHFATVLVTVLQETNSRRGLVDVFLGDRIFASFNTCRPCCTHPVAATGAAKAAFPLLHDVNMGIATGHALCGDVGCQDLRRFSVLGRLPLLSNAMERAGRALGCHIVCNNDTKVDAVHEHEMCLLPRLLRLVKVSAAQEDTFVDVVTATALFSVTPTVKGEKVREEEWMYQLADSQQADAHDAVVRAFLKGEADVNSAAVSGDPQARDLILRLGRVEPLVFTI